MCAFSIHEFLFFYISGIFLWCDELQSEQIYAADLGSRKSTRGRGDISIYNGSGLIIIILLDRHVLFPFTILYFDLKSSPFIKQLDHPVNGL
jgi:hypothetical protein